MLKDKDKDEPNSVSALKQTTRSSHTLILSNQYYVLRTSTLNYTCLQFIQSFQPDESDRTVSSGTPDTFICSCFEPESESDLDLDLPWSPRFCLSTSSEDEEDPGHSGPAVDEVFQDQQKD